MSSGRSLPAGRQAKDQTSEDSFMKIIWHALTNSSLLAVLVMILTLPVAVSLLAVSTSEPKESELASQVKPSAVDYGEFLSYGEVAGGAAESLSLAYTAFAGFTAYYDSVYLVENHYDQAQQFKIELTESRDDVRLFFAGVGQEEGPTEAVLAPGERATVTLAVDPVVGESSRPGKVSFIIQSLPLP